MTCLRTLLSPALLILMPCLSAGAASVQVVEESADGLLIQFTMPATSLMASEPGMQELALPGIVLRLQRPGLPNLPFFAELLAAPNASTVSVEVLDSHFVEYEGVDYAIAEDEGSTSDTAFPHQPVGLWPTARASVEYAGILRGVHAHALRLFPVAYDGLTRTLRVYDRMTLAVRFDGGSTGKRLATATPRSGQSLYAPFLNSPGEHGRGGVAAKPTQGGIDSDWYDPARKWIKVLVDDETIHRIDRVWFEQRFLDVDGMDPRTLQLFLDGEEQALYVEGEDDGSFDETDVLLFFGRIRRFRDAQGQERDHDSIYGRKNIYWLTWGGDRGKRFTARSGAPVNDYPASEWYWATSHFEFDRLYEEFVLAQDGERDHWFKRLIIASEIGKVGAAFEIGEIFSPFLEEDYSARLKVALHGATSSHHTVVKFNNQPIDDRLWEGQTELLIDEQIPSSYIDEEDASNNVLVQVHGDRERDAVYYNWWELQYRRRYDTFPGRLVFPDSASAGKRITLRKFAHPNITLFDVAAGVRITDALVEESPDGRYVATFEDAPTLDPFYVAADTLSMIVPRGFADVASDWRTPANGADYVIITYDLFVNASNRLAAHRRQDGLEAEVVSVTDIYDEFSGGQVQREAIADFIQYAYDHWERPPMYVLLMGDATYDYRNIAGAGKPSYVPTQYYQARERGYSPSDYFYTLVDGDDLLPDLALGRLTVSSSQQAEETVERIIRYDTDIEAGDWRSRVIYLANHHAKGMFTGPSDALARTYTEPFGLESVKIYNPDDTPEPNATSGAFLDALNRGSLMLNFAGHGSANFMSFVIGLVPPLHRNWDYLGQINNGRKLPLVLALSCLNGMFVIPTVDSISETFTTMDGGGAIAYISASAKSFVAQNDLLTDIIYRQIFEDRLLAFGPTLNTAKVAVLAAHSSWDAAALTMQLLGDPAQELALPTEADYTPVSLLVPPTPLIGSPAQVELLIRNNTRLTADSLHVLLLGFSAGAVQADTIASLVYPGFIGSRSVNVDWMVEAGGGPYRLEAIVDADDRIPEVDELNNMLSIEVEILEPVVAVPLFPAAGAVVSSAELTLEVVVPLSDEMADYSVEFLLGTDHDVNAQSALTASMPTAVERGIAVYSPESDLAIPGQLPGADLFWRARVVDGLTFGPWSDSQGFTLISGDLPAGSANEQVWRQQGTQLLAGEASNLMQGSAGELQISSATLPFRTETAQREGSFGVTGLDGAGIVCADGTYLYVKRWFNDGSTVYPGVDQFARIGSGFNGTEAGRLYGFLPGLASASISATYHSDGFIYNENGNAFELERLSTETGLLDTVAVPDGLLEWRSGLADGLPDPSGLDPHFLITSDGRYIYNASMSSALGVRTGWGIRVFDPADGWRLVREFTSPPTQTGFTYMWTDGLLADGERIYLIEFDDGYRIRVIDAFDGRFLDEWVSEQETTHSIAGQYDWVNDKVWLGDLWGSDVYRYAGLSHTSSGTLMTDPVGPAHAWTSLEVEGASATGGLRVDVLGEDESADGGWSLLEGYHDLEAHTVDLGGLDATRHPRLRLRATLSEVGEPSSTLAALQLRFAASPSLRVAAVDHREDDIGLHAQVTVRNLSPFTVDDARVVARTEDGAQLAAALVPSLSRGETRVVVLDSIPVPAAGQRLFAGIQTPVADADPGDNVLEIQYLEAPPPVLAFSLWPDGGVFVSGDPVRTGQGILIAGPGEMTGGMFQLTIDGHEVSPDSSYGDGSVLYRAGSSKGDHVLRAAFISGDQFEVQYQSEIRFVVTESLMLANPLVYPNPVTGPAGFTYVLSHEADVTVELYSLNGRLIRRLGPQRVSAGFSETRWDGRSNDGRQLANGTYLCRIRARDDAGSAVEHRAPFVVAR